MLMGGADSRWGGEEKKAFHRYYAIKPHANVTDEVSEEEPPTHAEVLTFCIRDNDRGRG